MVAQTIGKDRTVDTIAGRGTKRARSLDNESFKFDDE